MLIIELPRDGFVVHNEGVGALAKYADLIFVTEMKERKELVRERSVVNSFQHAANAA